MTDSPRGYGPRWGTICTPGMTYGPSPAEPLGAQSKKSKQVLKRAVALLWLLALVINGDER